MIVRILVLFSPVLICVAGSGGRFFHNQQRFVYQKPLFPAAIRVSKYRSQFTQMQPSFYRNTQQDNGIRDQPNPQRHVNPQQQYANHQPKYINQPQPNLYQHRQFVKQQPQFRNKQQQIVNQPQRYVNQPTSRPTPLLPPTLTPPQFIVAVRSSSNRVSERKCYDTYLGVQGFGYLSGGARAKIEEFPYMAAVGYRRQGGGYNYRCGGTAISSIYVLTAAHCRISGRQLAAVVKPGGARLDDDDKKYELIKIMDIIVHPNYKRKQVYDDIALLRLKEYLFGKPACLWIRDKINFNTATAIGYGETATRTSTSNDLFKVDLQLYSNQVCQAYYTPRYGIERGLIDSQICAGDFNKAKDTCPGSSGGPLLARPTINNTKIPYVLGLTSFGPECAEGIPGVYTKVSSYLDWIEPIVWSEG